MTKFHAGPTYTTDQQAALDAAFGAWLAAEAIAEYDGWRNETLIQASSTAYAAYKTLRAQFDAANEPPAPYDESMWDNYRRQRAAGGGLRGR